MTFICNILLSLTTFVSIYICSSLLIVEAIQEVRTDHLNVSLGYATKSLKRGSWPIEPLWGTLYKESQSQEMRQNPGHWSWILDHISWFPCKSLCLLPKSSSTTENNIWTQYDSFRPKKSNLVWLIKRLILVPLLVFAWFPLSCPSDQKYSFQIFSNSFHYQKSFVAGYMSKGQCVQNLHI